MPGATGFILLGTKGLAGAEKLVQVVAGIVMTSWRWEEGCECCDVNKKSCWTCREVIAETGGLGEKSCAINWQKLIMRRIPWARKIDCANWLCKLVLQTIWAEKIGCTNDMMSEVMNERADDEGHRGEHLGSYDLSKKPPLPTWKSHVAAKKRRSLTCYKTIGRD